MKNCLKYGILAAMMCLLQVLNAQTDTASMNADELFLIARDKAFGGDRETARRYLHQILEQKPGYDEVRVFLARTYSWDGKRDSARAQLRLVLRNDSANLDAISAATDLELWDDKPGNALRLADQGLRIAPNNEELLFKKAKALVALGQPREALSAIDRIIAINPSNADAVAYSSGISLSFLKNTVTAAYNVDIFSRVFDPAHLAYVQLGRSTKRGSVFLRTNYTEKFGSAGWQGEIDLYPALAKGFYAYLNYGYSVSSLFPRQRLGAELYFKLPKAFEGSAGLRYLYFSPTQVTLYTATLGKYIGDYWLSLRAFLTPDEAGLSNSYLAQVRKYLNKKDTYIGVIGSFGFSPDYRNFIQRGDENLSENIVTLKSRRLAIDYQQLIGNRLLFNVTFNLSQQEYLFDTGNFITIYGGLINMQYRF